MTIKHGFNEKESHIEINVTTSGAIELWLIQPGLPEGKAQETLSYVSLAYIFIRARVSQCARGGREAPAPFLSSVEDNSGKNLGRVLSFTVAAIIYRSFRLFSSRLCNVASHEVPKNTKRTDFSILACS